jgi:poly-gamma-glutamate synthesis protein (capsule biosynthesis protein)
MKRHKKTIIITLLLVLAIIGSVFFWLALYKDNIKSFAALGRTEVHLVGKKPEKNQEMNSDKKAISILFAGDLMADRYIRETIDKKGVDYIFSGTEELLKNQDLVVANLEGPITDKNSISINTVPGQKNHLIFTFSPILAPALASANIKLVNIGNNHIANFGANGVAETANNLEKNNVEYFGDTGENKLLIKEINGIKIGFINYNQFAPGSTERAMENIKNARSQADMVIVYTHWGTEYKSEPSQNIKDLGHKFIDNGADLVIGTHPHVIEPMELYKGKRLYYSLGNFIFDQYFSPETKKGLAVEMKIDTQNKSMDFRDIGLILDNNGQTRLDSL